MREDKSGVDREDMDRMSSAPPKLSTVDGGNLAPLEHKHPLFNIVRECGVLRTWSNDVNLAPPHLATVQCSKGGAGI